ISPPSTPAPGQALDSVGEAFGYIAVIFKVLITTVAILVLGFYWTLDGERSIRTLLLLAPHNRRAGIRTLVTAMESRVGAAIRGQALLNLAVGSMSLLAYLLIGLPYALVLGLIAGVMETVPILGPVLGAIPAILL